MRSLGQEVTSLPVKSNSDPVINTELFFLVFHAEKDKVVEDQAKFAEFKKQVIHLKDQGANFKVIYDFLSWQITLLDIVSDLSMAQFLNEQGADYFCGPIKNMRAYSTLDLRNYPLNDAE